MQVDATMAKHSVDGKGKEVPLLHTMPAEVESNIYLRHPGDQPDTIDEESEEERDHEDEEERRETGADTFQSSIGKQAAAAEMTAAKNDRSKHALFT